MRRLGGEQGQVLALTALSMSVLLGAAALVIDVGSWLREDRRLQATADAAALAGAQALPEDPGAAVGVALEYAERNGGGVAPAGISVGTRAALNDSISVHAERSAPGLFSRIVGIAAVDVEAGATARTAKAGAVRGVAPFAVDERHPLLRCTPLPCFGQSTQLNLVNLNDSGSTAAGAFGLVDLRPGGSGSPGAGTLAEWARAGYDQLLRPGDYASSPGSNFNTSDMAAALTGRLGTEMLLPVYRQIIGSGSNARFQIVGFVGFLLTEFNTKGPDDRLNGRFTRVTWDAEPTDDPTLPDFGVRSVSLVP